MRPVPIPDYVLPGNPRRTIGGEAGTVPAEYVIEADPDHRFKVSCLIELTDVDLALMAESRLLWLTFHGGELPWTLGIARTAPGPVGGE